MAVAITANTSASGVSGTSKTFASYNCNSASALLVGIYAGSVANASGVTYNGVSLTKVVQQGETTETTGNGCSWWLLFSPASGANDLVASWTSDSEYAVFVIALSGTATSGTAGTNFATGRNTATGNAMSVTTTPKQTGSYLLAMFRTEDGTNACSTNMTQLDSQGSYGCRDGYYATTTASTPVTQEATHTNGGKWAMIAVEVTVPVAPTTPTAKPFGTLPLMGVGM